MSTDNNLEFEDALKQLETIVHKLETEEPNLDMAIKLYEKGINLSRFCSETLENAEQQIEKIHKDESS